jgi:GH25 family lysozyme M1 (1,4-beta-N-acetylmuramidase)
MGINYSSFSIRGIDVSQFNGKLDWQVADNLSNFAVIRVGYGNNIDPNFTVNVEAALKTTLDLAFYWYGDYYSNWFNKNHPAYGLTDEQWGRTQADNCYQAIKIYGVKMVWLDIENITYKGFPLLTEAKAKSHAMAINKSFLERMNELGVKVGIYASLGWLSWFDNWFRSFPLWVAWYPFRTASVDKDDVIYMCRKNGWEVDPIIWQYASDGDVDDNGTPDGKTIFKTELKEMDLNGWVGTVEQYKQMFLANVETPDPIETPDDEVIVIPPTEYITYKVTAWPYLFIRKEAKSNASKVGLVYQNKQVNISEVVTGDGSQSNGWGKLYGQPGYMSMNYLIK